MPNSHHRSTPAWQSQHENDGLAKYGGRDLLGYGDRPPSPKWPKGGKVALTFVINYEEGSEDCELHGDHLGTRYPTVESFYDYGGRSGFWRLFKLFTRKRIPCTVFATGMALERNPMVCHALKEAVDWEVASHGYRSVDYQEVDEATQREHILRAVKIHEKTIGTRPVGFFHGTPNPCTRQIIAGENLFKYDCDSYADDLPYWTLEYGGKPHLIIPHTMSESDSRFDSTINFPTGDHFGQHLKDTLRYLIEEGRAGSSKMMTVDLHCYSSRPGRVAGLEVFIDYAKSFGKDVWFCTKEEMADFWYEHHYPYGGGNRVTTTEQDLMSVVAEGGTLEGAPLKPERKASAASMTGNSASG